MLGIKSTLINFYTKRNLIWQMSKREVSGRYKGSFLGLAWSLFNPILMLVVYTFVFSVIFKSRWGTGDNGSNHTEFAIVLFTGLIVFNLFSECISKAPTLITSNVNYVKKVVFPLEILPVINFIAALFHTAISVVVLVVAIVVLKGQVHLTILLLPIITFPLMVSILGLSWILASLGVFIRDVSQTIAILITVLMFLSPVFYPVSALPPFFQKIVMLNPIAYMIEEARTVVVFGGQPNWTMFFVNSVIGCFIAVVGLWFFQKTRKGFADVL